LGRAPDLTVRRAELADAEVVGRLLHDFSSEYDEPTPAPRAIAERVRELLAAGDITVLLGGPGRTGGRCSASARRYTRTRSTATWKSCTLSPTGVGTGSGEPVNYFYEREL
jgi:hypothetical protein